MGGGGGHRDRRSGGGSGGGSGDSREGGPTPVPSPDENESEEDSESSDESEDSSGESTSGAGGAGVPAGVPTGDSGDSGGDQKENPESEEGEDDLADDDLPSDEPADEESSDEENTEDNEENSCILSESATLHSPNPDVLSEATVGDICSVEIRGGAVCIVDSKDRTIGAIAKPWVTELKECLQAGYRYRAHIKEIDGGHCEVWITNKCLIKQIVELESINNGILATLHPDQQLSIQVSEESVIAITTDGTTVGTIPNPWDGLLKECLEADYTFEAIIQKVSPDSCTVKIQNGDQKE